MERKEAQRPLYVSVWLLHHSRRFPYSSMRAPTASSPLERTMAVSSYIGRPSAWPAVCTTEHAWPIAWHRATSTRSSIFLARAWQSRIRPWASLIRISPRAQAQADDSAKEGRISPGCSTSSCWTMSGTKESAQRTVVLWSTYPSIWDSLSRQGEVFEKRTWLPRSSLAPTSSNWLSIRKRSRCARDPSSGPGGPHRASGRRC